MNPEKIFTCPECDAAIDIPDPWNTDSVLCGNCGRELRLHYQETERTWELIPTGEVEEGARDRRKEEEPFQVLDRPGGPRRDDLDRY